MQRVYLQGLGLATALTLLAGCGGAPAAESSPSPTVSATGATGAELFAANRCAGCHGPRGAGTGAGPDLTDGTWIHFVGKPSRIQVADLIRTGVAAPKEFSVPMPAMGGGTMTEPDVQTLAAYVLTLSGRP